ncbi:GNAT family N-acetyltransferase [Pelagibacteraceae bacterium]|nr:GNAT family N-acetyltransferase [Pelagibacteraceae bacterium]
MKSISLINKEDLSSIIEFMNDNSDEYSYFKKIGWNLKNIESQFNKINNYSLGYFKADKLAGLLIGDKIKNNKNYDLELHILFVSKNQRRKQIATKLLNYVETNIIKFSQIFIEVAEDNLDAISFYKKNNFVFLNFRHNYYRYNNKNVHAKCFIKKINHE